MTRVPVPQPHSIWVVRMLRNGFVGAVTSDLLIQGKGNRKPPSGVTGGMCRAKTPTPGMGILCNMSWRHVCA